MQEDLTIICDEVMSLEPCHCDQSNNPPVVKMILDDVHIDPLMRQLVEKLDPETVLDYLTISEIKAYLEGQGEN